MAVKAAGDSTAPPALGKEVELQARTGCGALQHGLGPGDSCQGLAGGLRPASPPDLLSMATGPSHMVMVTAPRATLFMTRVSGLRVHVRDHSVHKRVIKLKTLL